jgi:predicted GNAT family acetyltransferase
VITVAKRGAGYGSTLLQGALDDVKVKGRTIVAECPFVQRFVAEHAEYADLLAPKAS